MALLSLPNLLSASRVPLAGIMFWSVTAGNWLVAVSVLWLAVATDVMDGIIARRTNSVSPIGGLIDHGSDAVFVTVTITALVQVGWAPIMLPILIPIAFVQYALDSNALAGQPLRTSFIGRYNGVAYFVFAGWPIMQLTLNLTPIPFDWFTWIGWGLVLTTVISMVDRLVTLLAARRRT